jgi:hypothetical protein
MTMPIPSSGELAGAANRWWYLYRRAASAPNQTAK